MEKKREKGGWPLWCRWALASLAGWPAGFFIGFVLASGLEPTLGRGPIQSVLAYLVLGVCLGLGVGVLQWLVLRGRFEHMGRWMIADAVGMGIAGGGAYGAAVLIFGYSEGLDDLSTVAGVHGWVLAGALGGLIAGLWQWRILLRRGVGGAIQWVPVSTIGWGLSLAVMGTISVLGIHVMEDSASAWMGLWILAGLVAGGVMLGAVTGLTLVRLISQPTQQA